MFGGLWGFRANQRLVALDLEIEFKAFGCRV